MGWFTKDKETDSALSENFNRICNAQTVEEVSEALEKDSLLSPNPGTSAFGYDTLNSILIKLLVKEVVELKAELKKVTGA